MFIIRTVTEAGGRRSVPRQLKAGNTFSISFLYSIHSDINRGLFCKHEKHKELEVKSAYIKFLKSFAVFDSLRFSFVVHL